jgi:hypothetical protein
MKHVKNFEQNSDNRPGRSDKKTITKEKGINVIDELKQGQRKPITINDIDDWFYGVTDVIYGYDVNQTSFFVSIYTNNKGENIRNLMTILNELNADNITISIFPTIETEATGIIYILWYKQK